MLFNLKYFFSSRGDDNFIHAIVQQKDGKWRSKNGPYLLFTDISDQEDFLRVWYSKPDGYYGQSKGCFCKSKECSRGICADAKARNLNDCDETEKAYYAPTMQFIDPEKTECSPDGKCVECVTDSDCINNVEKPFCSGSPEYTCVACRENENDCASGQSCVDDVCEDDPSGKSGSRIRHERANPNLLTALTSFLQDVKAFHSAPKIRIATTLR